MAYLNHQHIDQIQDALMSRDPIACTIAIGLITTAKDHRADPALLAKASDLYATDELEIDDVAGASEGDAGTWVQAWVWVPKPDTSYEVEPQRDSFKGTDEGADGSTYFVMCDEADAEIWAVFDVTGDEPELVEDFPSRAAAEAYIAELEAGQ